MQDRGRYPSCSSQSPMLARFESYIACSAFLPASFAMRASSAAMRSIHRPLLAPHLLTSGLIILGVVAVLLFVAVSGSFKSLIVGQIRSTRA